MKLLVVTPVNEENYALEGWAKTKTYLYNKCNAYESIILLNNNNHTDRIKTVLSETDYKGQIEDELDSRYHILDVTGDLKKSWVEEA